jgi:hypothetical protein
MDDRNRHAPQRNADIVSELTAMNVDLDYDVMRIAPHMWAIHGRIAYDSEIIAATFHDEREAWAALSPLRLPSSAEGRAVDAD